MTSSSDSSTLDLLDVEEFARAGRTKPPARRYLIRIDRTRYETADANLTGRAILALAGKTPETHLLSQKVVGSAPIPIDADTSVDLRSPGVERFMTIPREATEGREFRRDFSLSSDDREFLEGRREPWEAIADGGAQWVLLHNFDVPPGFNVSRTMAAVRLTPGYPEAALDMMYFDPPLARVDGHPINGLSFESIAGRAFQRWSRHRTEGSSWRVGEDSLATHCAYASGWLHDELRKR